MSLGLSKLGRFALGLAASGGAALLLAGSASAATASTDQGFKPLIFPVSTTQKQTVPLLTNSNSSVVNVTNSSSSSSSDKQSDSNASAVSTNSDNNNSQGQGSVGDSKSDGTGAAKTVTDNEAGTASESDAQTAAAVETTAQAVAADTAALTPPVDTPVARPNLRYELQSASTATITTPNTPVELATAPAAAGSPQQPKLPKTNGLLTALTDELAGTVVPDLFHGLTGLNAAGLASVMIAIILSLVLTSLISISYATVLRLSGYATAARSDVGRLFSRFATPQLLDYVMAPSPHIVLFGGVRNQDWRVRDVLNASGKGVIV